MNDDTDFGDLPDRLANEVEVLVGLLKRALHDRHPGVQGGVLADLLAMYLAGHAPGIRAEVLHMHLELVDKLVPANEGVIFGGRGHPATWDVDKLPEILAELRAEGRHELVRTIERQMAEAKEDRDEPPPG